jgi:hypothetical protein
MTSAEPPDKRSRSHMAVKLPGMLLVFQIFLLIPAIVKVINVHSGLAF